MKLSPIPHANIMKFDLKNIAIAVLFLLMVGSVTYNVLQSSRIDDRSKAAIVAHNDKKQAIRDKIKAEEALKQVRDSLETMAIVLGNANRDTWRAQNETKIVTNEHKKTLFRLFNGDTARYNAWAKLYPTQFSR